MTEAQFQQLLALLGQAGGTAYEMALQRAYVGAILDLTGWLIVFAAAALTVRLLWRWSSKQYDDPDSHFDGGDEAGVKILSGIAGGLLMFVSFICAEGALTDLLSPHYRALELLAQLVTNQ